jgi:hypothetical protein
LKIAEAEVGEDELMVFPHSKAAVGSFKEDISFLVGDEFNFWLEPEA